MPDELDSVHAGEIQQARHGEGPVRGRGLHVMSFLLHQIHPLKAWHMK